MSCVEPLDMRSNYWWRWPGVPRLCSLDSTTILGTKRETISPSTYCTDSSLTMCSNLILLAFLVCALVRKSVGFLV